MSIAFSVGQCWLYRTMKDFEDSRIIIGHIEPIQNQQSIICIAITHAPIPRQNGQFLKATIPFMAFSERAMRDTLIELEQQLVDIPQGFEQGLAAWHAEAGGLGFLQIPFTDLIEQLSSDAQDGL